MSETQPETLVCDTFARPCLLCGSTVRVVASVEQPHDCLDETNHAAVVAHAWWSGYDEARRVPAAPSAAEQPPPGITAWPEREKPAQSLDLAEIETLISAHDGWPPNWARCCHVTHIRSLVAEVKRLREQLADVCCDECRHGRDVTSSESLAAARSELSRTEGDLAVTVAEASRAREALREMRAFVLLIQKASVRKARDRFASAALRLVDAALRGPADREGGSADA